MGRQVHGAEANQHNQAIALYKESIPIRHRAGRDGGTAFATSLSILGRTLYARGEFAHTEPCPREALAIYRATHAKPHADIANASWKYAAVLRTLGRLQEADELLEQTLRGVPGDVDKARLYGTIRQLVGAHQAATDEDRDGGYRSGAEYRKRILTESPIDAIAAYGKLSTSSEFT